MNRKAFLISFLVIAALLALPMTVSAHQTVTVGDYDIEYGWVNEPAVVNQPNAVVINISQKGAQDANIDASRVQIQAVYGGVSKTLTLQPLGENTPGQFIAPMTPTRPGVYTIHIGGKIGSTMLNNDVQPEEIQTADVVQFPPVDAQINIEPNQ